LESKCKGYKEIRKHKIKEENKIKMKRGLREQIQPSS
jgi:hypothetical protein